MRKLFTLFAFSALHFTIFAQSGPQWGWGHANGNAPIDINPEYVHQAVAAHGNTALWCNLLNKRYLANEQYGDYRFSEYDSSGNTGTSIIVSGKLAVVAADADQAGNWYVLARYEDTLQFPSGAKLIKDPSGSGICMFRLNASTLALKWAKPVGDDFFTSTGCFTIGPGAIYLPVDSADATSICTMELATGKRKTLWSQTGNSWSTAIRVDSKENVYLAGSCAFNGLDFNGHPVPLDANFNYPQYIVRYKADGSYDWSYFMRDVTCFIRELNFADDNTIYYSGPLNDSLTIGTAHVHAPASFGSFMVCRLDSMGQVLWVQQMSDTATGEVRVASTRHSACGPDGSIRVYTSTSRWNDWGNGVTSSTTPGHYSATIVSYDKQGLAQWVKDVKGSYLVPQQIAASGNAIWVTGNVFDSTAIQLDQLSVPLPSGPFAYYPWVAKLQVDGLTTSITTPAAHQMPELAPNPAHDEFFLRGGANNRNDQVSMRIQNGVGQTVKTATIHINEPVSVSELSAGLYLVELTMGQDRVIRKLIVE